MDTRSLLDGLYKERTELESLIAGLEKRVGGSGSP